MLHVYSPPPPPQKKRTILQAIWNHRKPIKYYNNNSLNSQHCDRKFQVWEIFQRDQDLTQWILEMEDFVLEIMLQLVIHCGAQEFQLLNGAEWDVQGPFWWRTRRSQDVQDTYYFVESVLLLSSKTRGILDRTKHVIHNYIQVIVISD